MEQTSTDAFDGALFEYDLTGYPAELRAAFARLTEQRDALLEACRVVRRELADPVLLHVAAGRLTRIVGAAIAKAEQP